MVRLHVVSGVVVQSWEPAPKPKTGWLCQHKALSQPANEVTVATQPQAFALSGHLLLTANQKSSLQGRIE